MASAEFSAAAVALALCLTAGACGPPVGYKKASPTVAAETPLPAVVAKIPQADLDAAIKGAGEFLLRHTDSSGRFTYVVEADGRSDGTKYNVVRHAGTIYALGELATGGAGGAEVRSAIFRASDYLIRNHVDRFDGSAYGLAVPGGNESLRPMAVWSLPGEETKDDERAAKLGGIGLGLVGLSAGNRAGMEAASVELLRGLAASVELMQRDDGHFVSKIRERRGIDPRFVSLYYPGEAVLGLVRLYRIDRDRRWLGVSGKAIAALMKARASIPDSELPADHWLLIAIGEIASVVTAEPALASKFPFSQTDMLTHGIRIADAMLAEQRRADGGGAFTPDRRSTPTATRLEGIGALLASLPADDPARSRLTDAAHHGTLFLLKCQSRESGTRAGGIPRSCRADARGRRSKEIRIDYVQHTLSAFLNARRLGL